MKNCFSTVAHPVWPESSQNRAHQFDEEDSVDTSLPKYSSMVSGSLRALGHMHPIRVMPSDCSPGNSKDQAPAHYPLSFSAGNFAPPMIQHASPSFANIAFRALVVFLCALALLGTLCASASAQTSEDSRDASADVVLTASFIVGRIGRDCLSELGRPETPRGYLNSWRRENATYYDAADKYMAQRLSKVDDVFDRDRIESMYYRVAAAKGDAIVGQWFEHHRKADVCRFALTMIDTGATNVDAIAQSATPPIIDDLHALVEWAKTN